MNKHQEALDLLACNSEQWVVNHPKTSTPIHEIFYESDRAKDLLQELIDEKKPKEPCEYCTGVKTFKAKVFNHFEAFGDYESVEVYYCPHCGRKLLEGQEDWSKDETI